MALHVVSFQGDEYVQAVCMFGKPNLHSHRLGSLGKAGDRAWRRCRLRHGTFDEELLQ